MTDKEDKKFLVCKKDILSEIAKWAIAQSPYHRPDNLEIVLDAINKIIGDWNDYLGYKHFSYGELKDNLKKWLFQIPEFMLWNERKNGDRLEFSFIDRNSDVNQDNDFIDLDALIRNVTNSIVRRAEWIIIDK